MHNINLINFLFFIVIYAFIPVQSQDIENIPKVANGVLAPIDPAIDEGVRKGLRLVYQDRYEESLAVFDSIKKNLPDHPAPYFYKAAVYQSWMATYRFNTFIDSVNTNVEKAIELGEERLSQYPNDPWINFYMGGAYGYRAFAKMRGYNWIGAYLDGMKGLDNLKISLEKNPDLYDIYLGLGSYHYWRTARSSFIRIIAFWMSDKRDLGLEQYQFTIDHGRYSQVEASLTLLTVYYDYQKYDEMLQLLKDVENNNSISTIATKYLRGRLMIEKKEWKKVLEVFSEIYTTIKDYKYPSLGYQVECQYWMALSYQHLGKDREARNEVALALAANLLRNPSIEMESTFENYDQILQNLEKLEERLIRSETATKQFKPPPPRDKAVGELIKQE